MFSSGIRNFSHIEGAMYRLSDTMFLIDEAQIYKLWTNFGDSKGISNSKGIRQC